MKAVSHYKIIQKIGSGGMGVVYKAEDTRLRRSVVLKFLNTDHLENESARKRFLHEAQAASALDHPNICSIYEIDDTEDGRTFISMAFYDGQSLRERLAKAPMPTEEAFAIGFSVARGLSSAHAHEVIHRDIKPANIMITNEGYVKIVDFGLAKLIGRSRVTQSGHTVGTVAYMSPQQGRNEEVDHRTDIWSLGVMLYEMTTGKTPFEGEIDQAVIYSILSSDHKPAHEVNPHVPEECSSIIDKCLAKDVGERYQTADELNADIVKVSHDLGWDQSLTSHTIVPVYGRRRRHRLRAALAATVVLVLGAAATWQLMYESGGKSPYTTEFRLAVMPLKNLTGPTLDSFVGGLTETLTEMFDVSARTHESMWVIPQSYVTNARLANDDGARDAFGVNRIVRGNVQQFEDGHRLSLVLVDMDGMKPIGSATIDFDTAGTAAMMKQLTSKVTEFLGLAMVDVIPLGAFRSESDEATMSFLRGVGYYRDSDAIESAVAAFEQSVSADANFALSHAWLGWAYRRAGRLEESLDSFEAATRINPDLVWARTRHGYTLWRAGDPDRAIPLFRYAIALDPGNPFACRYLGEVYSAKDRLDESAAAFQAAIDRYPDHLGVHRHYGYNLFANGDTTGAIEEWTATLELAPNDGYTLNVLGIIYYNRSQWDDARRLLERSYQLWPGCLTSSNLGLLAFYEGEYEEAAGYYEFALGHCDPTDYEAWGNWAGCLYWVDGRRAQAIEVYGRAIELALQQLDSDPDNPEIMSWLIRFYAMVDDEKNAYDLIRRAERFVDTNMHVMLGIGSAYEKFNDRNRALDHIGNAIRHGYPVREIMGAPLLSDLITDPLFLRMIEAPTETPSTQRSD